MSKIGNRPVKFICEVWATNVKFTTLVKTKGVPPLNVTVEAPKNSDLRLLVGELITAAVNAWPPVLNDPFVSVSVLAPMFNEPASVQPPPTPLNVMPQEKVVPLVVIVLPVVVDENVRVPVEVQLTATDKFIDP